MFYFEFILNFYYENFDLKNKPRGRPKTEVNNDELKAIVEANDTQCIAELAVAFHVTIKAVLTYFITPKNSWDHGLVVLCRYIPS